MNMRKAVKGSSVELAQADGQAPELLLRGPKSGADTLVLTQLRFHNGARMRGVFDDIRISFNLRGSLRKPCKWRLADDVTSHVAHASSLYICPPKADCSVETDADTEILAVSIPRERLAFVVGDTHGPGAHVIPRIGGNDLPLLSYFQSMVSEAASGFPNGWLYWQALSDRIVSHMIEHHLSDVYRPVGGILTKAALGQVNEFIDAFLGEPIGLDDLAKVAGQSRFHFERTFKKQIGITPYRYLMRRRLEAAIRLIREGVLPLKAIAAETGFADQSHLARWSNALRGLRLTEYRHASPYEPAPKFSRSVVD